MSIKQVLASAGKSLHTIIIKAREEDGSVETREAEPYSYRFKGGRELLFCYDIEKRGTRSFVIARIISVEETANFICAALACRGLKQLHKFVGRSTWLSRKFTRPSHRSQLTGFKTSRQCGP